MVHYVKSLIHLLPLSIWWKCESSSVPKKILHNQEFLCSLLGTSWVIAGKLFGVFLPGLLSLTPTCYLLYIPEFHLHCASIVGCGRQQHQPIHFKAMKNQNTCLLLFKLYSVGGGGLQHICFTTSFGKRKQKKLYYKTLTAYANFFLNRMEWPLLGC